MIFMALERSPGHVYLKGMASYFIPYTGKRPAAMSINGHRVIIVSRDKRSLEDNLGLIGADRVKKLAGGESKAEQEVVFDRVARSIRGGVVVAPSDVEFTDVIKNLETQLPWLQ